MAASAGPADGPCVLCCGELDVVALGRCDHPICYRCSVRMRALCGVRYCAVCREELAQVRLPGPGRTLWRAGPGTVATRAVERTEGNVEGGGNVPSPERSAFIATCSAPPPRSEGTGEGRGENMEEVAFKRGSLVVY